MVEIGGWLQVCILVGCGITFAALLPSLRETPVGLAFGLCYALYLTLRTIKLIIEGIPDGYIEATLRDDVDDPSCVCIPAGTQLQRADGRVYVTLRKGKISWLRCQWARWRQQPLPRTVKVPVRLEEP